MQVQKQRSLGSAEGRGGGGGVGRRPALPRLQVGVITEWTQLQGDRVLKLPGLGMQPTAPRRLKGELQFRRSHAH